MKRTLLFCLISCFSAINSQAGTTGPVLSPEWSWVATISGGPSWASAGETQTFYLAPEIVKTYAAQKTSHALVTGEFFLSVQKNNLFHQWIGQLGIEGAISSRANLQGRIWDDADPLFDNFHYQYKVQHNRIAAKGKLLLDNGYCLMPWLSGSVGAGFNRAYDFLNTPLIVEALPNSNFRNYSKTSFVYTLGAGVQKAINQHFQVGVGYEFADWGKFNLGPSVGQILNSGLNLNHLYTNSILFYLGFAS